MTDGVGAECHGLHWTENAYCEHATLFYEVDVSIYEDSELTSHEVDMAFKAIEAVGHTPRGTILDLACGTGRHAYEFAYRGMQVVGLDMSAAWLSIAARRTDSQRSNPHPRISLIEGDMRSLPFSTRAFRQISLLGNGFGYFSDAENAMILKEIARILDRRGVFVFDLTDCERYIRSFAPYSQREVETRTFGNVICAYWREWQPERRRMSVRERYTDARGQVLYDAPYDVRQYTLGELRELLANVGFRSVEIQPMNQTKKREGLMRNRIMVVATR